MNDGPLQRGANALVDVADTAKKVSEFLIKVIGQPLEQASGMLDDQLRLYRYKNLLNLQDKIEAIHKARKLAGKTIPIPPRFAMPILEAAALEDDESLRILWARLLANATDPNHIEPYHPAYCEILKQLSGDEALIMTAFANKSGFPILFEYREVASDGLPDQSRVYTGDISSQYEKFCRVLELKNKDAISTYMDNFIRLRLIEHPSREHQAIQRNPITGLVGVDGVLPDLYVETSRIENLTVTHLGIDFINCCIRDKQIES